MTPNEILSWLQERIRNSDFGAHNEHFARGLSGGRIKAIAVLERYRGKLPKEGDKILHKLISALWRTKYRDHEYGMPWELDEQYQGYNHALTCSREVLEKVLWVRYQSRPKHIGDPAHSQHKNNKN